MTPHEQTLSQAANVEVMKDFIIPTVSRLATDPIPNIRFNVAKAFSAVIPVVKKMDGAKGLLSDSIKPSLLKLSEDSDADVRFFSQKALSLM